MGRGGGRKKFLLVDRAASQLGRLVEVLPVLQLVGLVGDEGEYAGLGDAGSDAEMGHGVREDGTGHVRGRALVAPAGTVGGARHDGFDDGRRPPLGHRARRRRRPRLLPRGEGKRRACEGKGGSDEMRVHFLFFWRLLMRSGVFAFCCYHKSIDSNNPGRSRLPGRDAQDRTAAESLLKLA